MSKPLRSIAPKVSKIDVEQSPNNKFEKVKEKAFLDVHTVAKTPDANGNDDDVFNATNVKRSPKRLADKITEESAGKKKVWTSAVYKKGPMGSTQRTERTFEHEVESWARPEARPLHAAHPEHKKLRADGWNNDSVTLSHTKPESK